jgi:hypothetical protein
MVRNTEVQLTHGVWLTLIAAGRVTHPNGISAIMLLIGYIHEERKTNPAIPNCRDRR